MNDKTTTRDDYVLSPQLTLSLNLSDFIAVSGRSQNQIAKEAGLASSTLSSYITGARYPRPAQLQALAKVLGTTVAQLVNAREPSQETEEIASGSDDLTDLIFMARQLNMSDRKTLTDFAEFLLQRRR